MASNENVPVADAMTSHNPYSPPKTAVRDAVRARLLAERPPQIVRSTALLWLVLVLSLISTGLVYRQRPESWPTMIGTFALGVALSVVRIVGVWQGRNWARVTSVVIATLTVIVFPAGLASQPMVPTVLDALTVVLELIVLFLVFTRPGFLWFKYTREER